MELGFKKLTLENFPRDMKNNHPVLSNRGGDGFLMLPDEKASYIPWAEDQLALPESFLTRISKMLPNSIRAIRITTIRTSERLFGQPSGGVLGKQKCLDSV
jgi:hypothetical protein